MLRAELGNDYIIKNGCFYDFIPDNIEVDHEGNVYLCDKSTKMILKLSPEMDILYKKEISKEFFKSTTGAIDNEQDIKIIYYNINLETDISGNLYALISMNDLFTNLISFTKNGDLRTSFQLSDQIPFQYIRDFFISDRGKIFINTFPFSPQDIQYVNDGLVFVYDLNGDFLGRTDYFIEDKEGVIYKRNLLNPIEFQLDSYKNQNNEIMNTTNLELIRSLNKDYSQDRSWHFLGVDKLDNIYFTQGQQNLLFRKFNFSNQSVEDIKIEVKELENLGVLFYNNFNNISLSPDGNILFCGIRNSSGEKPLIDRFSIDDVILTILTINH
jgi:hypothetical protein